MAQRTDIHRPSAPGFDPEAYELRGVFDWHSEDGDFRDFFENLKPALLADGYRLAPHATMSQCGHCGHFIRYAAIMAHAPSMDYIVVGQDCLGNRFEALTASEFQRLRKDAALNRQRSKLADQRSAFIEANPVIGGIPAHLEEFGYNDFLADINRKFQKYANLSEKQVAAVQKSMERDVEWAAKRAQDAAEAALALDVPEGRQAIKGEVVSIKWHDSEYGGTLKMVVKAEQGWKVWGSVPEAIAVEVEVGDTVTFTATVTRSDRDPKFGFFKRPTKAAIIG